MIQSRYLLAGALATSIAFVPILAASQNHPQTAFASSDTTPKKQKTSSDDSKATEDEGQLTFAQHCSRCHNAPDGFSPRISGTVVRHMRVRASLSQHEEDVLLHFFNP